MKSTIHSLIATLSVLIIIAGCESNTSTDDSFEPYKIGTWEVINDTTAYWIGENGNLNNNSADRSAMETIFIIEPGLRLQYGNKYGEELSLRYTDSTIAEVMLDTLDFGYRMVLDTPLGSIQDSVIFVPTMSIGGRFPFSCDSTYSEKEQVFVSYMQKGWQSGDPVDSESVVETRQFTTGGLYQTANDLVCR